MHWVFEAGGQKAKCNLCGTVTDVPPEHCGPIDDLGRRTDGDQRPEYKYGTFELRLPDSWLETTPVLPAYVFCLDISSTAIMNGFFYQAVAAIKQCLDYFQNSEQTEICFVTYD